MIVGIVCVNARQARAEESVGSVSSSGVWRPTRVFEVIWETAKTESNAKKRARPDGTWRINGNKIVTIYRTSFLD